MAAIPTSLLNGFRSFLHLKKHVADENSLTCAKNRTFCVGNQWAKAYFTKTGPLSISQDLTSAVLLGSLCLILQMSATHPQPTESIFLVPHSIIIMIQVMWPCRNCRYWWCCLWSASGHCQRGLHLVDSTRMCMDREITINLVGNLPRRSPGAGNSFQVLQCPVLHRLMCRVFVLCYPKLWKWGSSGQVCPGGLVSNSCFFFCCWH